MNFQNLILKKLLVCHAIFNLRNEIPCLIYLQPRHCLSWPLTGSLFQTSARNKQKCLSVFFYACECET